MEIEIKARVKNLKNVEKKLVELGASAQPELIQLDEYFNHPNRNIVGSKEHIRLRSKQKGEGESVVFSHHTNISDGVNQEIEAGISDLKNFREILKLLGIKKLGQVKKKRRTFYLGEYIVTLDRVEGVGDFVEVEAEGTIEEIKPKKEGCRKLLKEIGITESQINAAKGIWLCDIATGAKKP